MKARLARVAAMSLILSNGVPACVTDAGYEPPVECSSETIACDGACVDVLSDRNNCGMCGSTCGVDALCVGGECLCGGGLTSCEQGCADITTDPENCGECGRACDADQVCSGGDCAASCPAYELACGRSCVDPNSNPDHCGDCDESCSADQACKMGRCACAPGTQDCAGSCADIESDPDNCGGCGAACASSEVCRGGRCGCPGGSTACAGSCVDLFSSDSHCGQCDNACGADEVCSAGQCRAGCEPGLTRCDRSCVDPRTDERHCGGCDSACSGTEICVDGECQCPPGSELCDGSCVDLRSDEQNCGSCGLRCAAGQACAQGRCECPNASVLCGTACVDLDVDPGHCGDCDTRCEDDEVCSGGSCTTSCSESDSLCDASCVDLGNDGDHCGDCQTSCDPGQSCGDGACKCSEKLTQCGGVCVDTSISAAHCGQCDRSCADDERCVAGECLGSAECSDSCPHASGISWGCHRRFMYGVNYAWETFAGDFGGIPAWDQPGVSGNEAAVDERLTDMAEHGVDVVRWWVWPDFRGDGVRFDASGTPSELGATATVDLDKALELADQHDLHLMLTLFSFDNFRPSRTVQGRNIRGLYPIATDSTRRVALIDQIVRPFARAADQSPYRDRLIAWDVINEPEWAMTGPSKYCDDDHLPAQDGLEHLTHEQMESFVSDVIAGLRAESDALITVGGAALSWRCAWKYVDIDFYQFHIYDWVDQWYPYDRSPGSYGVIDKPAIMGEFPMDGLSRASYRELLDAWYDTGWAGALGWAVTDRGIDWSEAKADVSSFYDDNSCETNY